MTMERLSTVKEELVELAVERFSEAARNDVTSTTTAPDPSAVHAAPVTAAQVAGLGPRRTLYVTNLELGKLASDLYEAGLTTVELGKVADRLSLMEVKAPYTEAQAWDAQHAASEVRQLFIEMAKFEPYADCRVLSGKSEVSEVLSSQTVKVLEQQGDPVIAGERFVAAGCWYRRNK
jgi:hypothetical protein